MAPQLVCIFIDAVARTAHFMKCIVRRTRIILKRSVLFFIFFCNKFEFWWLYLSSNVYHTSHASFLIFPSSRKKNYSRRSNQNITRGVVDE